MLWCWWSNGRALVVVRDDRGGGCCIVGAAALLGCEDSGGLGPAGAALPGQEGSGEGIDYGDKDGE